MAMGDIERRLKRLEQQAGSGGQQVMVLDDRDPDFERKLAEAEARGGPIIVLDTTLATSQEGVKAATNEKVIQG